jgi:hypothetical protein
MEAVVAISIVALVLAALAWMGTLTRDAPSLSRLNAGGAEALPGAAG